MHRRFSLGLSTALAFTLVSPAFANVIVASGAGSLPATAQNLTTLYPTEITGSFDPGEPNSVNVFEIDIMEPALFSAQTIDTGAFGVDDPELFLFDSSGNGVYMNDDETGGNTQACLPSASANPCPSSVPAGVNLTPGDYYLAIAYSENMPIDGLSNEIFSPALSTDVVGPNGGVGPVAGWDDNSFASPDTDLVNYQIDLSGTVPEAATGLLSATACIGFLILRRRRTRL